MSQSAPLHSVVFYVFSPSFALHSDHNSIYNQQSSSVTPSWHHLTFRIGELNKDCWTKISLLILIWKIVFWYAVGWMIDNFSHILFICWILTLTVDPNSFVLNNLSKSILIKLFEVSTLTKSSLPSSLFFLICSAKCLGKSSNSLR